MFRGEENHSTFLADLGVKLLHAHFFYRNNDVFAFFGSQEEQRQQMHEKISALKFPSG